MTAIYCDRLTPRIALAVAARRLTGRWPAGGSLSILDGAPAGAAGRLSLAALTALGCRPAEAQFFAGHLRLRSGESVPAAARKEAFRMADRAADLLVRRLPVLAEINDRWQRETVRLHVAKQLWVNAERVLLRVMTVEALAERSPTPAVLYVRWPAALPPELMPQCSPAVDVRAAGRERPNWKSGRFSGILWMLRQWMRSAVTRAGASAPVHGSPALLVPQEDDLSLDRSFRSQPHWLDDVPPTFRTIVLRVGTMFDDHLPADVSHRAGIEVASLADVAAAPGASPLVAALGRDLRRAGLLGLRAWHSADSLAANNAARLLTTARELARFCTHRGVKAFLTCENYLLHADAMQVVAPPLGIRTLSYQYSNMPNASLPMIATADRMMTFSAQFHTRFRWSGYHAPEFADAGYIYDSSFALVGARARERRESLEAAGARFVIGFFDESVQRDKYGWLNLDDYATELLALLELVERDPSIGLVFKTQFQQNLRGAAPRLATALERGIATGRVKVPSHGRHRNVVLPAEVARSSDITIGHVFGGTASLESALAGCRSLMINACDLRTESDVLYAQADIIRPSMADAFAAIDRLRRGDPGTQALGDWTPILHHFDPYRDGRSAERLRATLEQAVLT